MRATKVATIIAWTLVSVTALGIAALSVGRVYGYELYSIASDSMRPMINVGDAVLVHRTQQNLRVGDVVSFHSPVRQQVIITHRIIRIDHSRQQITTKGDNASSADLPISNDAVIGKEALRMPVIGFAAEGMKHPIGLAILVYLPAIGILVAELQRLNRYYARYEPRRYVLYR